MNNYFDNFEKQIGSIIVHIVLSALVIYWAISLMNWVGQANTILYSFSWLMIIAVALYDIFGAVIHFHDFVDDSKDEDIHVTVTIK